MAKDHSKDVVNTFLYKNGKIHVKTWTVNIVKILNKIVQQIQQTLKLNEVKCYNMYAARPKQKAYRYWIEYRC